MAVSVSNEVENEFYKTLFDGYSYEVVSSKFGGKEDFDFEIRCDLNSEDRWENWKIHFEAVSHVHWIVSSKTKQCKSERAKFIFKKDYVCQHARLNKKETSFRNKECLAALHVRIKKNNKYTRFRDAYVKKNLCTLIKVSFRHTHRCDEARNSVRPPDSVKEVFISYLRAEPDTGLPWVPKELSVVCGLHFSEDQYKKGMSRKILKPKAVPTIFPNYPSYIQKDILKKSKECISDHSLKPKKVVSAKHPRLHRKNKNRPFIVKCNVSTSKSTSVEKAEFESRSVEVNELDDIIRGASDVNKTDIFFRNNNNDQNVQSDESMSDFECGTSSIDECENITRQICAKENYDELGLAKERIQILEEKIKFLETENKRLLKDNECLTKMLCARV